VEDRGLLFTLTTIEVGRSLNAPTNFEIIRTAVLSEIGRVTLVSTYYTEGEKLNAPFNEKK